MSSLSPKFNKMLEKDLELRYQSAHEVWADLKRLKGDSASRVSAVAIPAARRRWLLPAAIGLAVIAIVASVLIFYPGIPNAGSVSEANSLVVLPCDVYGAKDSEYLTEAIPGSLSTLLSQVEGLETKSPPTVFEFEKVHRDPARIAAEYKVQRMVRSSVTAEADQFVLNVQLLDSNVRILWASLYRSGRGNYSDMVQRAAEDLRKKLRPASSNLTSAAGLAANSDSELMYRQGKYFSNQYNNRHQPADFDHAFADLKRALELDPKLADAAAEIAMLFVFKAEGGGKLDFVDLTPEIVLSSGQ